MKGRAMPGDFGVKKPMEKAQRNLVKREPMLTKVVVRRLPPSMTEDEFLEAVSPLPEHDYCKFISADKSLGSYGFSRVYLNFKNLDEIYTFKDKFDGYVFVDQKGNEYSAIVEFSPLQKIPKRSSMRKKDIRCGTIDSDPDYVSFLESLESVEPVLQPAFESLIEEYENQERELRANKGVYKVKTPLLEYIENRKAERIRNREERREEKRRREIERRKREEERRRRREMMKENVKKEKAQDAVSGHVYYSGKYGSTSRKEKERDKYKKKDEKCLFTNSEKVCSKPEPAKTKRYSEVRKRGDKTNAESNKSSKEPADDPEDVAATSESKEFDSSITDTSKSENVCTGDFRNRKDPRTERRIKNKDRPAMQLYRPGQSKLSRGKGSAEESSQSIQETSEDKKSDEVELTSTQLTEETHVKDKSEDPSNSSVAATEDDPLVQSMTFERSINET